jgi:hypothetical protein
VQLVVQFHSTAVLIAMKVANPTPIEYADFEDDSDIAHDLRHETPEQPGYLMFCHPNRTVGGGGNHHPPIVYRY